MELRKLSNDEALKIFRQLSSYESHKRTEWIEQCRENRNFYFGKQTTLEEYEDIIARGQFPHSINKIRKAVRGIVGMFASALPKFAFTASGKNDETKAIIANKIIDWVFKNSDGIHGFKQVVKRAVVDNISYFHVIYSEGKVKYLPLTFEDVLVPPSSRDSLFRDAGFMAIYKYIPLSKAKAMYGIQNFELNSPLGWDAMHTDDSMAVFLGKIFSSDEEYVKVYEIYRKIWDKDDKGFYHTSIRKETVIGYDNIVYEDLPKEITEFPIIPVYVEDTENPYKLGEVHFLKGLQKFINKAFGVTLYNAQMLSNPKVLVRETDIPNMDISEFEDNFSTPGAIGVLTAQAGDPTVIQGQPLNNAFFSMYQDAKAEFEMATIPQDVLGYSNSGARQNTSYLLDKKESVMDTFKDFSSNIDNAVKQLAIVSMQYVRGYIKEDMLVKITDSDKIMQYVASDQKQGLDASNPKSLQAFENNMRQKGMPDEQIQSIINRAKSNSRYLNTLYSIKNDSKVFEYDIVVIAGSYSPTYKMAMLRLMFELYNIGAVDNVSVIDKAPIDNKGEIISRMNTALRLQSQLEQTQQQLGQLQKQLESRENQIADLKIDQKVGQAKLKQDKVVNDTRAKAYLNKKQNQLTSQEIKHQTIEEAKRILHEAKIEAKLIKNKKDNDIKIPDQSLSDKDKLLLSLVGGNNE